MCEHCTSPTKKYIFCFYAFIDFHVFKPTALVLYEEMDAHIHIDVYHLDEMSASVFSVKYFYMIKSQKRFCFFKRHFFFINTYFEYIFASVLHSSQRHPHLVTMKTKSPNGLSQTPHLGSLLCTKACILNVATTFLGNGECCVKGF